MVAIAVEQADRKTTSAMRDQSRRIATTTKRALDSPEPTANTNCLPRHPQQTQRYGHEMTLTFQPKVLPFEIVANDDEQQRLLSATS